MKRFWLFLQKRIKKTFSNYKLKRCNNALPSFAPRWTILTSLATQFWSITRARPAIRPALALSFRRSYWRWCYWTWFFSVCTSRMARCRMRRQLMCRSIGTSRTLTTWKIMILKSRFSVKILSTSPETNFRFTRKCLATLKMMNAKVRMSTSTLLALARMKRFRKSMTFKWWRMGGTLVKNLSTCKIRGASTPRIWWFKASQNPELKPQFL